MSMDKKIIVKLREMTGAGMVECQKALAEAAGDLAQAQEILRKKGAVKAARKLAERTTKEGLVASYIHPNGKVGVLIEVACETDFVARNNEFKNLVHDLAMQVAAANPLYVAPSDVPTEVLAKEKEIYTEQLKSEKKSPQVAEKVVLGKLEKFYSEVCLIKQPFIKDDKITVAQLISEKVAVLGEKIEIKRFSRFQL